MIRVLVVDDHPAMRAGLETALGATPDLAAVGAGSDQHELWHLLKRTAPEVVLLDYHLPGEDGLTLCHRLKNTTLPPAVIVYSAYADMSLAIAASVAGADGIVNKSAPAPELFEAIRRVAAGEKVLPTLAPDEVAMAAGKLEDEDRPLFGMLLGAATMGDVAATLQVPLDEAAARIRRVIGRLGVAVPGT